MKLKRMSLIMVLMAGLLTTVTFFSSGSVSFLTQAADPASTPYTPPPFPDAYKVIKDQAVELPVPGASPNHLTHPCGGMSPEPAFSGLSPLSLAYLPGTSGCGSGYGDIAVWQEGGQSYAGIAKFGGNAFHIFNVTDPYNPFLVVTQPVGSGGSATLTIFSFKKGNSRYISTSTRGSGQGCGFFIYNIDNVSQPVQVSRKTGADWCIVHEHFVSTDSNGDADYAWLAMSGESGSGDKIVVLNLADLSNPIETGRYERPDGVSFIHDSNVVGNRAYVAHWSGGMQIFDKATLANNINPVPLNPIDSIRPSSFMVHHVVPTTDGRFVFIEDEFLNASNAEKIKYYNIENVASPVYVGGIVGPDANSQISQAHNMRIMNVSPGHDILFAAWYRAGTRIFDVDTSGSSIVVTPRAMHQLRPSGGSGFGGVWGVDYLPCTINGVARTCVYSSDYEKFGVQIDALDYDPMLDPYKPESTVSSPTAGQEITTCTFTISGTAHDYYSGVQRVEVSTDDGATWQQAQGTTNWTYEWNIPADGAYTIKARAVDVAGNVQDVMTPVSVTVNGACSVLTPTASNTPGTITAVPTTAVPTTAVPTTAVPTTAVPTTAVPTTAVPTTAVSTSTRTATAQASGTTQATTTPCSGQVTICHRTGNGNSHTITVSCNALAAHMAHGDTVGACPAGTPRPRANRFSDVGQSEYFFDYVLDLNDDGAISGYADSTFRPYNQATRAQLVKIVVLAFHLPLYSGSEQSFSDVPTNHPFYREIETAQRNGLVGGYSDGTFRPYNNVTRGQIAKIAVEAANMEDLSDGGQTFSDVPPGSTFYSYIETAFANGILSGYSDGTFRPNNDATRGQVAKIVDIATHPNTGR